MDGYSKLSPRYKLIYASNPLAASITKRQVYKITLNDNRKFILKCIEISMASKSVLEKLSREFYIGRTLGALSTHIVKTIDIRQINKENGNEMIAEMLMEYGGKNLDKAKEFINSNDLLIKMMLQLIEVLELMEQVGVAHFDLKPMNIVWDKRREVLKIIDFGTSMSFYSNPNVVENPIGEFYGRIVGFTEIFAPPELLHRNPTVEIRQKIVPSKVDVFSFGMTFLYLLISINTKAASVNLKWGTQEDELAEFFAKITDELRDLSQGHWANLIKACLQFSPENRPSFTEIHKMFMEIIQTKTNIKLVTNTTKQQPEDNSYHKILADSYFELKQYDVASIHYEMYLKKLKYEQIWKDISQKEKYEDFIKTFAKFMSSKISIIQPLQFTEYMENSIDLFIKLTGTLLPKFEDLESELENSLLNNSNYELCNSSFISSVTKYLLKMIENINQNKDGRYSDVAKIYDKLGKYFANNRAQSLDYFKKALEIRQKTIGENHLDVAKSYERIGKMISTERGSDLKDEYLIKALEIRTKIFGENSIEAANAIYKFAEICKNNGDPYEKYMKYFLQSLDSKKKILGEAHLEIAKDYENLGKIEAEKKNYDKAFEYLDKSLEIKIIICGKENEENYSFCIHFIDECIKWGKLEKAEEFAHKATEISLKNQSEKSKIITDPYENLAYKFMKIGKYEKAATYFEKAIELKQKVLCENFLEIAKYHDEILMHYARMWMYEAAERIADKSVEIKRKALSENNPNIYDSYDILASKYAQMELYDKSEQYCEKAVKIRSLRFGQDHPCVAISYDDLGNTYYQLDKPDKAIYYLKKSLEIKQKVIGEIHPDLSWLYRCLAQMYEKLQQRDLSIIYQRKYIECLAKNVKDNNSEIVTAYSQLGLMYEYNKKYEDALNSFEKCVEFNIRINGENSPKNAEEYIMLSQKCAIYGKNEKVERYCLKAIEILLKNVGENHPDVTKTYEFLGKHYMDCQDFDKAIEYYFKSLEIAKKGLGSNNLRIAEIYDNLAWAYAGKKLFEKANEYCKMSQILRAKLYPANSNETAELYQKLGEKCASFGLNESALEYYEQSSIIIYKSLGKDNIKTSDSLCEIGRKCSKICKYEKAIEFYMKSVEIMPKFESDTKLAKAYDYIAEAFLNLQKYDNALEFYNKALTIQKPNTLNLSISVQNTNFVDLGMTLLGIGYIHFLSGQYEKALEYYKQSEEELSSGCHEEWLELARRMVEIYDKIGHPEKAKVYAEDLKEEAEKDQSIEEYQKERERRHKEGDFSDSDSENEPKILDWDNVEEVEKYYSKSKNKEKGKDISEEDYD